MAGHYDFLGTRPPSEIDMMLDTGLQHADRAWEMAIWPTPLIGASASHSRMRGRQHRVLIGDSNFVAIELRLIDVDFSNLNVLLGRFSTHSRCRSE
jgi:hypothetical protein